MIQKSSKKKSYSTVHSSYSAIFNNAAQLPVKVGAGAGSGVELYKMLVPVLYDVGSIYVYRLALIF